MPPKQAPLNYLNELGTIEQMAPKEQAYKLVALFNDLFAEVTSKETLLHGQIGIVRSILEFKDPLLQSHKARVEMYKRECDFLEEISSMPSMPHYLVRFSIDCFINNLEGRSSAGIDGLIAPGMERLREAFKKRVLLLYRGTSSNSEYNQPLKKLPKTFTEKIISSPFYTDLYYLIGRGSFSSKTTDHFKIKRKVLKYRALLYYLILALRLKITNEIKDQVESAKKIGDQKALKKLLLKTMPPKSVKIEKVVLLKLGITKDQFYGLLREIMDPEESRKSR